MFVGNINSPEMSRRNLRKRGVAVVIRRGHVLLVRDKHRKHYSLPGGACHKGERSSQAAARELDEETGLKAKKTTWLGSFKGAVSEHRAYLVEADGHVHLNGSELSSYIWWDMKSQVPIFGHVKAILSMMHRK